MLNHSVDAVSLSDLAAQVFSPITVERDPARTHAIRIRLLDYIFALLSHIRAEVGRAALGLDVHLWSRELSRVDRAVRATAAYRWSDDGTLADETELFLPAVFCRHCGRSGWGVRLAPTGSALDVTDEAIRADHAAGPPVPLPHLGASGRSSAPGRAGPALGPPRPPRARGRDSRLESPEVVDGRVLPVLTLVGPDADEDTRPTTSARPAGARKVSAS